jgi:hypothetical protein
MATQIQLVNRALTRAGAARIMDVSENTKSGRAIAASYDGVRDSALATANWKFAMERATLAATTAQDGYGYAYTIPADWLRFVEVRDKWIGSPLLGPRYISDYPELFQIERNRTLLTNFGPPLKARGVKRIEDASQYDPLFNDYFVLCLCVEVWEDVSRKSATKLSTIIEERNRALSIARVNNAIQEPADEIDDTSWMLSRVGP